MTYVQALGTGRALVQTSPDSPPVTVATDRTFKPGSKVMVGRDQDTREWRVIAGPGAGEAGASSTQAQSSSAPAAQPPGPVTPEGEWFAYAIDESAGSEHVDAWTYDGTGAVAVELTTWTAGFNISSPGGGGDGLILPASRTQPILCGAKLDGAGDVVGVWVADLTDGTGWTHDTAAGWYPSAPIPYQGRIYWMEAEISPAAAPEVRLFSAAASTDAQTATQESSTTLAAAWGGGTLIQVLNEGRVAASLGVTFLHQDNSRTGATCVLPSGSPVEIANQLAQDRTETSFDGTGWQYGPVFGGIERIDQAGRDAGTFGSGVTVGSTWGSGFHLWMDVVGSSLWILDDLGALHRGTESTPESSPLETITLTSHPTHGAADIVHKIA